MKKIVTLLVLFSFGQTSFAQTDSTNINGYLNEKHSEYIPVFQYWKEHDIFQHLDVSLTAGSPGIGLEVSSPIGKYFQVRAGYEIMPRFTKTLEFGLTIDGKPARQYDSNGNRIETKFDRMEEMLYQMTGYDVEDHVDMVGKPTISNFKLLLDVFPFRNKQWYFTAGFYWGPSQFAVADNSTESMISLLSVGMYNRMYDKVMAGEPIFDWTALGLTEEQIEKYHLNAIPTGKFESMGRLGFAVGYYKYDVYGYFKEDVFDENNQRIHDKGEYGVIHKAGERYIMEPGSDGMVHVKAKSNSFKPYLGFGYSGNLKKGSDEWKIGFDAGAMFWGGTPDLINHEGVNLTKDIVDIDGQVGRYVNLFKAFKVYPVFSLKLTKRIF